MTDIQHKEVKIKRNAVRCKLCDTVIESKHRHDFVRCRCGSCFTDGGHSYIRRGGKLEHMESLTEYE